MPLEIKIFDLDKTFFRKNTSFSFYFYLLKRRVVHWTTLFHTIRLFFRFSSGSLSVADLHHQVFRHVLKGLLLKDLEEAADQFLAISTNALIRPSLFELLQTAKMRGAIVCLLSSSPEFLVTKVGKLFAFDRSQGTEYLVDKDGRLCEIASLITGPEKKEFAEKWVEKMGASAVQITAYSDSSDDLPLLEWAHKAVAVCPDPTLKRIAADRNWEIL